ncbi:MAG: helix-turn-helix transcriptional regulator, partial [Candidatus Gastranaerophilales bacterium]|nr:helix-turn-helix transcriptional regulator [Candidatus Gastranaerophilales bacterium]
ELLGKTRNYVGMVERAELNVSVKSLFDFAKVLNVEPKEFFEF